VFGAGIACIIGGGTVLGATAKLDNAAPVLEIQKQLLRVRKAYVIGGLVLGLPWWVLRIPFVMVLAGLAGVDVFARAPSFVYNSVAIGMLGTWWFFAGGGDRRGRRPCRCAERRESAPGACAARGTGSLRARVIECRTPPSGKWRRCPTASTGQERWALTHHRSRADAEPGNGPILEIPPLQQPQKTILSRLALQHP
jgi:hypothetical protein